MSATAVVATYLRWMDLAELKQSTAGQMVLQLGQMAFTLDEVVSLYLPEDGELALVGMRDGDVATCHLWHTEWQAWWLGEDNVGPLTQMHWAEALVKSEGMLELGDCGPIAGPVSFGRSADRKGPVLRSGRQIVAQADLGSWQIDCDWYERLHLTTRALPNWPPPAARDRPSALAS